MRRTTNSTHLLHKLSTSGFRCVPPVHTMSQEIGRKRKPTALVNVPSLGFQRPSVQPRLDGVPRSIANLGDMLITAPIQNPTPNACVIQQNPATYLCPSRNSTLEPCTSAWPHLSSKADTATGHKCTPAIALEQRCLDRANIERDRLPCCHGGGPNMEVARTKVSHLVGQLVGHHAMRSQVPHESRPHV